MTRKSLKVLKAVKDYVPKYKNYFILPVDPIISSNLAIITITVSNKFILSLTKSINPKAIIFNIISYRQPHSPDECL